MEEITQEEIKLDLALAAISEKTDLSLVNPSNAEQVKRSFHAGDAVRFTYPEIKPMRAEQRTLRKLRFPNTTAGRLLKGKQQDLLMKIALFDAIGSTRFPTVCRKLYPAPSAALLRRAEEILHRQPAEKPQRVRLQDAFTDLQHCFEQLGMDWRVQKMNMVASASVMPSQRTLYLKRKELFSQRFIKRLKIHEIGTHAVRAENGRLQPLKIFLHGLGGYLETEEGLAVYNEERFGLLDATVLRNYAGRVVAVSSAAKGSFSAVVEHLQQYFLKKQAVTLALRAKRGLSNGDMPGGFTKDAVYLKGYLALKKHEAAGGDFKRLYVGKVGLQHLALLDRLPLVEPRYLPNLLERIT